MHKDITFSWFSNSINDCIPQGLVNLEHLIQAIKAPKHPEYFDGIMAAKAAGDTKKAAELKQKLYYFSPAVIIKDWRNGKNIVKFTGLCPVDFDKMTPAQAVEFKAFLFDQYPCFFSVWVSASRHGVRGLIRIPVIETIEEYKSYFFAIQAELSQYGYHFDTQLQSPVQPMYQAYDPEILYRPGPELWDVMTEAKPQEPYKQPPQLNIYRSERQRQSAIDIILKGRRTSINQIVDSDGHPRLRNLSRTLGGYVGGGYLTEFEAISFMENEIDRNAYLRQKAGTYKKTSRWAIKQGQSKELKLITTSSTTK